MKIAVAGKGGVGKTTISGTIARALAREGHEVIAVDADVNPMLGISLGLGMDATESLAGLRQRPELGPDRSPDAEALLAHYGADAPDGVRVLVASRVDEPDSGCPGCGMTADRLLCAIDSTGRIVLGDMEAGIGVLARMATGILDVVLVVTTPAPKAIEVARRATRTAVARDCRVIVVANRVRSDEDLEAITAVLGDHDLVLIPDDAAIADADAEGLAPIDVGADAPGVRAIIALSERLAPAVVAATSESRSRA